MDLEWSRKELEFRDEVRSFLDEKLTPELRRAGRLMTSVYSDHESSMAWQPILHERGWAAPAWPVEHGGCDWSLTQHYIFSRESTLAGAPSCHRWGSAWSPTRSSRTAPRPRRTYFLPRILTGEVFFCQGYSEPESGSDLASLSMAAVDDGDDLVCTGSKIWTTHATEANWMFALVRTTRTRTQAAGHHLRADRHDTPRASTIRPLVMTSGEEMQNQVFFDEVRVPKANVLGEIDDGWTVAKYLLEFERGGGATSPALQVMADEIATAAAAAPGPAGGRLLDDPAFAHKFADARIRTDVLEILEYRVLATVAEGGNPGAASSMLKVLSTELSQTLTELALEAAGPRRPRVPAARHPSGRPGGRVRAAG